MADEEEDKEYRWETGYEKTWEVIQEDKDGFLEPSIATIIQKAKRRRQQERHGDVRLGMMRHLFIIVDLSARMTDQDLKPTRQICTFKLLEGFMMAFFDQNPISQIGIIITRNKRAERVSEMAGNPKKHIEVLKQMATSSCGGEPSLQNSLELALQSLRNMPGHASREILLIFASLTTCDPADINVTIQNAKKHNVRCSVVGLAAEVRICKLLCKETGGDFGVIMDESHYKDLVYQHVNPPAAAADNESCLIRMGFPQHFTSDDKDGTPSMCMCHLDATKEPSKLSTRGYVCPQCSSKYCELPVECRACGLTLVSAPHLARSFHHLFPIKNFLEIENAGEHSICHACQKEIANNKIVYQCEECKGVFCFECDMFAHEALHTCPGCATNTNFYSVFQGSSQAQA